MAAKSIRLQNVQHFASIGAAKVHFDRILKNTQLNTDVTVTEFREVKALYEAYCAVTNWALPSPPVAFFPTHEQGKGFTTTCFGVRFADGSRNRFSLDRALSAVATRG